MILEWDNPWSLVTPEGTLPLNAQASLGTTPLGYFLLDPAKCSAGTALRVTRNNIAQGDGEITYRKFKTGYVVELSVQLWESRDVPACGYVLRAMGELLDLHLGAIDNADGRIEWTPSSNPAGPTLPARMLDKARSLGPSGQGASGFVSIDTEKDPESPLTVVTFALLSPLPYAMDVPQTTSDVTAGATLFNSGNADFYPVVKVHGPTPGFILTNNSATDDLGNVLQLTYNGALPGAINIPSGHYAELDFFRNTVYLDGDGANLKAGIDVLDTDYWPLVPGANDIDVSGYGGALVEVLWQPAYL